MKKRAAICLLVLVVSLLSSNLISAVYSGEENQNSVYDSLIERSAYTRDALLNKSEAIQKRLDIQKEKIRIYRNLSGQDKLKFRINKTDIKNSKFCMRRWQDNS